MKESISVDSFWGGKSQVRQLLGKSRQEELALLDEVVKRSRKIFGRCAPSGCRMRRK
jgi:hypothetical protein